MQSEEFRVQSAALSVLTMRCLGAVATSMEVAAVGGVCVCERQGFSFERAILVRAAETRDPDPETRGPKARQRAGVGRRRGVRLVRRAVRLVSHFLKDAWLSPEGRPANRFSTLMSSSTSSQ